MKKETHETNAEKIIKLWKTYGIEKNGYCSLVLWCCWRELRSKWMTLNMWTNECRPVTDKQAIDLVACAFLCVILIYVESNTKSTNEATYFLTEHILFYHHCVFCQFFVAILFQFSYTFHIVICIFLLILNSCHATNKMHTNYQML